MSGQEESKCRHCEKRNGTYARGLCGRCYKVEEIREQYPKSGCGGKSLRLGEQGPLRPATKPTHYPPGSPAKMDVMSARLMNREELFHPEDAKDAEGFDESIFEEVA